MDTDRELLEAAAKAAGIVGEMDDTDYAFWIDRHKGLSWNPLTDDGDALRLAVALNMGCNMGPIQVRASTIGGALRGQFFKESRIEMDPCAAMRRAIVLAAAEAGRAA